LPTGATVAGVVVVVGLVIPPGVVVESGLVIPPGTVGATVGTVLGTAVGTPVWALLERLANKPAATIDTPIVVMIDFENMDLDIVDKPNREV
jgi:hypothetical protein